jgi:NAD+ synthetase
LGIDLKEVSTIIKDFIKTYVENSGCKGVVIGLSGGIDSAVTAVLCKQTLGKKKIHCLFLPDDIVYFYLTIQHQNQILNTNSC